MKIKKTSFKDCFLIEKKIFKDQRGFFFEIFKKNEFNEILKKKFNFVQDNLSYSYKGVLRGLHYQKNKPQGKLVRVVCGSIYDVVVDIRKNSPTFGKWEGFNLNSSNNLQIWVPPGFAHGFLSLSNKTIIEYKCTEYYNPNSECGILWNDDYLNIKWPINKIGKLIVSKKDKMLNKFKNQF